MSRDGYMRLFMATGNPVVYVCGKLSENGARAE
jgi:hypothetical protein